MSTVTLDDNGDWTFGRGLNAYLTGVEEVRQNVATRVKEFKDDWFLDVEAGVDWINYLGTKGTKDLILSSVKKVILETTGVASIISLDIVSNSVTRELTLQYELLTIYDERINSELGVFV